MCDDEEYERCGPHTTVPPSFEDRFKQLVIELENETGKMYTVKVQEFGANTDYSIRPFSKRDGYRVYNMTAGYEGLEGVYKTTKDLKNKITELRCSEATEDNFNKPESDKKEGTVVYKLETKTLYPDWAKGKPQVVFVCPKCQSFEHNYTYSNTMICQHCRSYYRSKWDNVGFGVTSGRIYKSDGGSISICTPLGYLEVLNESTKGKATLQKTRPTGKSPVDEIYEQYFDADTQEEESKT